MFIIRFASHPGEIIAPDSLSRVNNFAGQRSSGRHQPGKRLAICLGAVYPTLRQIGHPEQQEREDDSGRERNDLPPIGSERRVIPEFDDLVNHAGDDRPGQQSEKQNVSPAQRADPGLRQAESFAAVDQG
jgi:hypothetical protein